jgi:hypothetical protein
MALAKPATPTRLMRRDWQRRPGKIPANRLSAKGVIFMRAAF